MATLPLYCLWLSPYTVCMLLWQHKLCAFISLLSFLGRVCASSVPLSGASIILEMMMVVQMPGRMIRHRQLVLRYARLRAASPLAGADLLPGWRLGCTSQMLYLSSELDVLPRLSPGLDVCPDGRGYVLDTCTVTSLLLQQNAYRPFTVGHN